MAAGELMRKFLKNNILDMLCTMYEAHIDIKNYVDNKNYENAQFLLQECQNAAIHIGTEIEKAEYEGFVTVGYIEKYCEALYEAAVGIEDLENGDDAKNKLDLYLQKVSESVKTDIKVKLEIVFCPYKVSMWDSLESIWRAALEDEDCNVSVVVVPYYDRNADKSMGELHYEGSSFPDNVPVIHYDEYDFSKLMPDVIYIHNPYDEGNYVTSVDPRFYSDRLKRYTDCLVYVPYFTDCYFNTKQSALYSIPRCINNIDVFVLQSYPQREALSGIERYDKKMVVLGSPKLDKAVNNDAVVPKELLNKIRGRKTIMVNTSISGMLKDKYWKEKLSEIIDIFEKDRELFLIWRPHPLLYSTANALKPEDKAAISKITDRIEGMENTFIDSFNTAHISMKVSDGMISNLSSLVVEYTATGKPVLLTECLSEYRKSKLIASDFFSNYFVRDGESYEDFCNMIKQGKDYKAEERMKYFKASVVNTDGTCGQRVHKYIKKLKGEI